MSLSPYNFNLCREALRNGEHVTSPNLWEMERQTDDLASVMLRVPAYTLVVDDLLDLNRRCKQILNLRAGLVDKVVDTLPIEH